MDARSIIIYCVNALVSLGAFGLVYSGKITWQEACILVAALLTPSAIHVAMGAKPAAAPPQVKP